MATNYSMSVGGNPHLDNLTPEQRQQFDLLTPEQQTAFMSMLMSDFGADIAAAESEMSRADALRFRPKARGREAGGMYVAANPLEHLADVLRHRKGSMDYTAARDARQKALDDRAAFRRQLGERLISRSDLLKGMGF